MQNSTTGTEYTPTTQEVREKFADPSEDTWGLGLQTGARIRDGLAQDFDRWLANYTCDVLYDAASRLNSYHPAWEQLHDMAEQAREKGVMREH